MTRNTSTNATSPADDGNDIMRDLLAAFEQLAKQKAPSRPTSTAPDRDPWEGVQLSSEQIEALTRLGWYAQGWTPREKPSRVEMPRHLAKSGPQMPDAKKVTAGQADPEGLKNWIAIGMVCARLAVYGRLHVGQVARLLMAAGATGDYTATPGRLATKLSQVLKTRIKRSEDGFFIGEPNGRQAMHDTLSAMADRILKTDKPATKPTKPVVKAG